MYDDPRLPYRCPKCFQSVSTCTMSANGKYHTCGCLSCSCDAPVFEQNPFEFESPYMPRIRWDRWVIQYRKEHPDYHKDYMCRYCLRDRNNCEYYNENALHCLNGIYPEVS